MITLGSHVIGLILLPNFAPAYFTYFWNQLPTHHALLLGYSLMSITTVCVLPVLMKKSVTTQILVTYYFKVISYIEYYNPILSFAEV